MVLLILPCLDILRSFFLKKIRFDTSPIGSGHHNLRRIEKHAYLGSEEAAVLKAVNLISCVDIIFQFLSSASMPNMQVIEKKACYVLGVYLVTKIKRAS